jgi:hypothetical protein
VGAGDSHTGVRAVVNSIASFRCDRIELRPIDHNDARFGDLRISGRDVDDEVTQHPSSHAGIEKRFARRDRAAIVHRGLPAVA